MSADNDTPRVCKDCAHFVTAPADPLNLGAPRMGECRAVPPVPVVLGFAGSPARPIPQVQSIYPPLVENSAACGVFKARTMVLEAS